MAEVSLQDGFPTAMVFMIHEFHEHGDQLIPLTDSQISNIILWIKYVA